MEQLATLAQAGRRREPADRRRPGRAGHRPARAVGGQAAGLRRPHPRHRRAHHARRGDDERGGRDRPHRQPVRDPAGRRRADRPGRGAHRQGLPRAPAADRPGADPRRRRRPRRRGAVDARGHRPADQVPRRLARRSTAWTPSTPAGSPAASSGQGDIVALVEKAAAEFDQAKAEAMAKQAGQGPVRPRHDGRAARPDEEDGRHGGPDGPAARRAEDQEADRRGQHLRQDGRPPGGDHLAR